LQQRFAIASPHPPKSDRTLSNFPTSFFNEPQRHRGHRERAIAPPSTPKQRSHSLQFPKQRSHPSNFPNSDRTPSNLPKAIAFPPTSQHPFLTNHRDTEDTEKQRSHPLNSPNSDRTSSTPKQRSHPFNSQTAIASLQPSKQRSHPLNFPNSDRIPSNFPNILFLTNRRDAENAEEGSLIFTQHPFLTNHEDAKNTKEEEKRERSHILPQVLYARNFRYHILGVLYIAL
jgi:hypothetical protein